MAPKCWMITGRTKTGLLTEYAYLKLDNRELASVMMCYALPVMAEEFRRGNMSLIDINREDIKQGRNQLSELRHDLHAGIIEEKLRITEKRTKIEKHKGAGLGVYLDYSSRIKYFLERAYIESFSNELEIIAR